MRGNKTRQRENFFSLLISIIFERLNYGCFQGILCFQTFWGKYFKICEGWQEYSMDERSVQHWTTEIVSFFNLFCLLALHSFPFTKFKLSQLVLKWPWSCRSNLQKCLEHLNLAKIIKWKFKFYVKQKELPQILHSKGFF